MEVVLRSANALGRSAFILHRLRQLKWQHHHPCRSSPATTPSFSSSSSSVSAVKKKKMKGGGALEPYSSTTSSSLSTSTPHEAEEEDEQQTREERGRGRRRRGVVVMSDRTHHHGITISKSTHAPPIVGEEEKTVAALGGRSGGPPPAPHEESFASGTALSSSSLYASVHFPHILRLQARWRGLPSGVKLFWLLRSPQGFRFARWLRKGGGRQAPAARKSCRRRKGAIGGPPLSLPLSVHQRQERQPRREKEEALGRKPAKEMAAPIPRRWLDVPATAAAARTTLSTPAFTASFYSSGVRVLLGAGRRRAAAPTCSVQSTSPHFLRENEDDVDISRPASALPVPPITRRIAKATRALRQRQQRAGWRKAVRRLVKGGGGGGDPAAVFLQDIRTLQRHVLPPAMEEAHDTRDGQMMQEEGGSTAARGEETTPTAAVSVGASSPAGPYSPVRKRAAQQREDGVQQVGVKAMKNGKKEGEGEEEEEEEKEGDFLDYCEANGCWQPRRVFVMTRLLPHLEKLERGWWRRGAGAAYLHQVRALTQQYLEEYDANMKEEMVGAGNTVAEEEVCRQESAATRERLELFQQSLPSLKAILQEISK